MVILFNYYNNLKIIVIYIHKHFVILKKVINLIFNSTTYNVLYFIYIIITKNYYFSTVLYKNVNNLEATCSKCSNYIFRSEF